MREEYLEILVEEKSMEVFLQGLLPKILPEGFILNENCLIRAHNGKQDLRKQIPIIVKAYQRYPYPVRTLIIHDQDSADCVSLKQKLIDIIEANSQDLNYMVRIACRELENWYLGDLNAVEQVYPASKASRLIAKAKFRNPDRLNGSEEMLNFSKDFGKVNCAREIAKVISIDANRSNSFNQFRTGLQKLVE